ncbi:hypothetical protein JCM10908_004868 [Rhodotorula pacifica]|uniref:TVP38/TMEM64 family protein n=1 Tax=Rhodotorula pacifica TaxID=1495444 RepID=UPI00316CEF4F
MPADKQQQQQQHHSSSSSSRASAYRPQPIQTRLRARSIGKASNIAPPPSIGDDAPTVVEGGGSARPLLHAQGRTISDITGGGGGGASLSALARQRAADFDQRRVKFSERATYDYEGPRPAGTEESSGSTLSDSSPPHTPREEYDDDDDGRHSSESDDNSSTVPHYWVEPPSRRGSSVLREEREAWRTGGEAHHHLYDPAILTRSAELPTKALPPMYDHDEVDPTAAAGIEPFAAAANGDVSTAAAAAATRNRSKSLEGLTRMSLRRGRSFTSLLVQPAGTPSPAAATAERRDPFLSGAADRAKLSAIAPTPIIEHFEMAPMLGRSDAEATLYPPATGVLAGEAAVSTSTPRSLRDFVPQLVILFSLFVSSFVVIALTIATLPGLFLPHSVADLPELTKTLTTYRASSYTAELHLFVVLTLLFLWKQCFSIPGSILTNILFGALYGTTLGTWWACLWTATGSTGAYLIAVLIAPLVEYYFAKPLDVTRRALKLAPPTIAATPVTAPGIAQVAVAPPSDSDLFSHLLLARFFPLLPYSVLNVIAGVLRLPLGPFFTTLLIGSFPFNFATVSIGNLVALAAADPSKPLGDKIWSREVVLKLVAVTFISVVPLAFKDRLRALLSNGGTISFLVDRTRNAVSRAMFGFSAVPHSSITASTASIAAQPAHRTTSSLGNSPSSGHGGPSGGPRAWRRKLSRSIGNAADLLMLGIRGKGFDSGAASDPSGYAYERIANGARESATGVLDDAEMGGVDPRRARA